jgi:type II secretion system protein N
MAEASLAPPFGWSGPRRALATAVAAILLTGFFVVLGFPYDRVTPRIESAIVATTGVPVRIGRLGFGVAWLGPQLRAWDVDATLPNGKHLVLDRLRVHPAWSLSWLRGAPALVVALRSPSGEIDGTVTFGREYGFDGELRSVQLSELPLDALAPGASLDGRASGAIDLVMTDAGPVGAIRLDAEKGSVALPLLPIGIPFDTLRAALQLGGELLAKIDELDVQGPLVSLTANGTIGQAPAAAAAPLALHAKIAVRDPSMRSLFAGQGVALDASGAAEVDVGGTLGEPLAQAAGTGRRMPR